MAYEPRLNVTELHGRVRFSYLEAGQTFHLDAGAGRILACVGASNASVVLNYAAYQDLEGNTVANGNVPVTARGPGQKFISLKGVDFTPASGPVGVYYVKD